MVQHGAVLSDSGDSGDSGVMPWISVQGAIGEMMARMMSWIRGTLGHWRTFGDRRLG